MALTSALFTGLSGLDVNQNRLNIVGNNIANANTVAFKSSRALFKPQFYVTDDAGTSPTGDFGGTNPDQHGLGATVASVERDFTPGALEPTGKDTDMAIDGDGFFVLNSTTGPRFTRDGSFSLNSSNQLVTSTGDFVQGYPADASGTVIPGVLQNITIPIGSTTVAKATSTVTLNGNLDAAGAVANGASILTSQLITTVGGAAPPTDATLLTDLASSSSNATPLIAAGETFNLQGTRGGRDLPARSFTVTAASTVADLNTFYAQGMGINTTVPDDGDPTTPPPGTVLEADSTDPNSARLVITGNLGKENALSLTGTGFSTASGATPFIFGDGTDAAGIVSNPSGESVHTSFVAYDSLGNPVTVDVTAALESKSDAGNTWRFYATSGDNSAADTVVGTGTLTFDAEGQLKASTGTTLSIDRTDTGAKTPMSVKLDLDPITSSNSRISSLVMTQQDGSQIGTLNTFSVGADGTVVGAYSNGQSKNLGQVALATFANNQGLVDKGGNQFIAGADSGVAVITDPGQMGAGQVRSGALEQSNVDLSKEFVNMIISSTGFSAASRVITTSDQLITDLLNSAR